MKYIFENKKPRKDEATIFVEKKHIDVSHVNFLEKTILEVKNLFVEDPKKPFLRGIDISIKTGKIIGFGGVKESGLETLELALAGFLNPKHGTVMLNDINVTGNGVKCFRKAGAAYLSGDRIGTAMAYDLPVFDSLIIHAHRRFGENCRKKICLQQLGFMDKKYLTVWTNRIMEKAAVHRSTKLSGRAFSGGMIQRILLQRELAEDVNLFILSEPVWGLDKNAAEKVIRELKDYAAKGKSILVFSADLDFLISVSDEVIVLQNGSVSASFINKDYSEKLTLKNTIAHAMINSLCYHNSGDM
jgi:simple sugar transport system ATP-binding protein